MADVKETTMRGTLIAGGLAAAALAIGLAIPAVAAGYGNGDGVASCDGTGPSASGVERGPTAGTRGPGGGRGSGAMGTRADRPGRGPGGGTGAGIGAGTGMGAGTVTGGTLTDAQQGALSDMAEEEKLAGDLYAVLGARYDDAELNRIAAAEDRHLAAVQRLLVRYGVSDPTAGMAAGEFNSATFARLYTGLLATGRQSLATAYEAGVAVETQDIADLTAALSGITAPDVTRVYTNLRRASQSHLAAFQS
jgi:hypothetical protein